MFGGFEFFLFPIALLGLLAMAIAAVVGGRSQEDPLGRRPFAIYLCAVSFISLIVVLFALSTAMSSIGRIAFLDSNGYDDNCIYGPDYIECGGSGMSSSVTRPHMDPEMGPDGDLYPFPGPPNDNSREIRTIVEQVAMGLTAGAVLLFHRKRLLALVNETSFSGSPAERTFMNYLYAVCFVAVLVALATGAAFLFAAFRAIAPGVTSSGPGLDPERNDALVQLLSSGVLGAVALFIFRNKWQKIEVRSASLAPTRAPEPPTA